jgi:hypothetical protein
MKTSRRIKVQTWYGMGGTVIIAPGFLHRTGLGWFFIPHPPLINLLLRQGLLKNSRNFGVDFRAYHNFNRSPDTSTNLKV